MPPVPIRRKSPLVRLARGFFLCVGIALLGCVGYVLLDAKVFQAREIRRWNLEPKPSAQMVVSSRAQTLPVSTSSSVSSARLQVALGSAFGRMDISRIGISVVIVEGIDGKTLRRGVGHVPGSALPGDRGNVAIAGHRDTYFRALRDIRPDDEVTLTTTTGTYRYRVDWIKIVDDEADGVLSESNDSILTLVTCYPFYFVGPAPKRFIVRAHKV